MNINVGCKLSVFQVEKCVCRHFDGLYSVFLNYPLPPGCQMPMPTTALITVHIHIERRAVTWIITLYIQHVHVRVQFFSVIDIHSFNVVIDNFDKEICSLSQLPIKQFSV